MKAKNWNRIGALLLTLVMALTLLPSAALARVGGADTGSAAEETDERYQGTLSERLQAIRENYPQQAGQSLSSVSGVTVTPVEGAQLESLRESASLAEEDLQVSLYEEDEMVRVLVVLEGPSLLEQGFTRSEIAANGAAVARKNREMLTQQSRVVNDIRDVVEDMDSSVSAYSAIAASLEVEVTYHYSTLINGVALEMPYGALAQVRALDNVAAAILVPVYSVPEDMTDSADTHTYNTQSSFGSALSWDAGYSGAGMTIAIIDTGLDTDHPSFADAPADPSMTEADIAAVLEELNAYERYSSASSLELTAANLYRSEKIAYAFNYVDNDLDVTHDNDSAGDHGTHVAGISAANRMDSTDVVGVAPDAQLLVMKVFGKAGGAYYDDILAALEDCITLDVDAVNMSLGSPAGFSVCDEDDQVFAALSDYVYGLVESCDMVLAISAGNSYSAAYMNNLGTNLNFASDPDNSVVSSPATFAGSTMVASLENDTYRANYIEVDGQQIAYSDVAAISFTTLAAAENGPTYEYVMVGGYGSAEDFAAVDVAGKIAVVSRGELAFTDKQTNAYSAGAVGCIVYDNVAGDLINMQDAGVLPNIFVTQASGQILAEGSGTLTVGAADEMMTLPSATAGQMSDFSSWGVGPDLTLEPDVTAPGGNIYATLDGGKYGTMSGTSMSAPHITGMAALVLEYLHETYPGKEDSWYHTAAEALIMSTAEPVVEPTGVLYSPRKQGAGAANVYSAVSSAAYLTVDGSTPKVSAGDDDSRTGVYAFSFEINNLTSTAQTYRLDGSALTDQVLDYYGFKFMGETSRNLDAEFAYVVRSGDAQVVQAYDYNGDGAFDQQDVQDFLDDVNYERADNMAYDLLTDGVLDTADVQAMLNVLEAQAAGEGDLVTVPANGTATVRVTVSLTRADMDYMDENYENGIYVDGFVRCYALGGGQDLSLPFLAFYGDWSDAPVFDDGAWWYDEYGMVNRYYNIIWTDDELGAALGMNVYLDEAYDEACNVLSPNGDGYQDLVDEIYLGLMRNAKKITFTWTDSEGNEVFSSTANYVRKSYYLASAGVNYPFIYGSYLSEVYDFLGEDGQCAYPDLSRLTFTITAYLDDGDDLADDVIEVPVVIDTTAPTMDMESVVYTLTEDGGRQLTIQVSDNYDIAAVAATTLAGDVIDILPVSTKTAGVDGETATITLDVSGYDAQFLLAVCDYGCNETYYQIAFEGDPSVNSSAFYGYRGISVVPSGNNLYVTDAYKGWHSFTDPTSMLMHTSMYRDGTADVAAADYVDGYVIGVDVNGSIFAMKAGYWTRNEFGTMGSYPLVLDMAYDFANQVMYVLTDEEAEGAGGWLLKLDILTGDLTEVGRITGDAAFTQGVTLACDNAGTLYTINYADGALYTVDGTTAAATYVGATGYQPLYSQSMTVDHATDTLYWAAYQGYDSVSAFFIVDKATGALTLVDYPEYNSEITALYKPNTAAGGIIPTDAALTGLKLSAAELSMAAGNVAALTCQPVPYYAELGEVTWTSSAPAVATVTGDGVVLGVGAGVATITASCGDLSAQCSVLVRDIQADLVVYDAYNFNWLEMTAAQPQGAAVVEDAAKPSGSYNVFTAAAYVDGDIYAFDSTGVFYKLDADTLQGSALGTNTTFNGTSGQLLAMSFNYADGYLYGVAMTGNFLEMYFQLVRINPANGQSETVLTFDPSLSVGNLAVDLEGNFYSVVDGYDENWEAYTNLVTFRLDENGAITGWTETTLEGYEGSGYNVANNSLVYSWDDNGLFWADCYGQLLWIYPETGDYLVLGEIDSTASGYPTNLCLVERGMTPEVPNYEAPVSATMQSSFLLLEGANVSANVTVEPWNARGTITYTMEDTSVATVDETGMITAVATGETVLTAYVAELDLTLRAAVTVVPSAGTLNGYVLTDFMYSQAFWVAFEDTDPAAAAYTWDGYEDPYWVYAGAYYDGAVYAYCQVQTGDYKYHLVKIDLATYDQTEIAQVQVTLRDMAFDYTTGTMYAIAENGLSKGLLAQVDLTTGEVCTVGATGYDMAALTVTADGSIYAIAEDCNLYAVDKTTGSASLVGATGVASVEMLQSMHCDLDTGNVYWTQVARDYSNGLYLVNLTDGSATKVGTVGTGAEVLALYTVPETETVPASVEPTGVALTEKAAVVVGSTVSLQAAVLPLSVAEMDKTLTWSSSNETVATVADGVVTGLSAGTATITATDANGNSAACTVTVTESERSFYAYDETNAQWITFPAGSTGDVTVVRQDAEGEGKILASLYLDGSLYAYDETGAFYTLDPDTFERTKVSDAAAGMTVAASITDYWSGATMEIDVAVAPVELTYDETTGRAYGLFVGRDPDYWVTASLIGEVDLTTGAVTGLYSTSSYIPANLLVKDGRAFFVDGYTSGMLTYVDLYEAGAEPVQHALVYGYWGDYTGGRSLYEDPLTGTIYAIRDNNGGSSSLWILHLGDASVESLGLIGTEGIVANSLFLK